MYAARTKVPVDQTRIEIERALKRYGADRFAYMGEPGHAAIMFEAKDRRVRFRLPLPKDVTPTKTDQLHRQRWRALLLCIMAKLESVQSGIESFEDAFLAHVVLPDGSTVGEHTKPRIAALYKGEPLQPLLPAPKGPQT
jgi:hypothetical protein